MRSIYSGSVLWCYCVPRPFWATGLLIGEYPIKGVSVTNVNHWNQSENCCCCRGWVDIHRCVWGCEWFYRVLIAGAREYTTRFLILSALFLQTPLSFSSIMRDLTAALWHAVVLRRLRVLWYSVCHNYSLSGLMWVKCAGCAVQLRVSMCVWLPRSADQLTATPNHNTETHADTELENEMRSCAWLSLPVHTWSVH